MIANRMQFEAVKAGVLHPSQFGGVKQHSTEDAGMYLTHIVKAGWAAGLQTSVIAFNLAQFFPLINHEALIAIMRKQGFSPRLVRFFESYLVGRQTSYCWNGFESDPRSADVGVGQGSALSPVLSVLIFAPVMHIFHKRMPVETATLMSYVDDGTAIVQSRTTTDNVPKLV